MVSLPVSNRDEFVHVLETGIAEFASNPVCAKLDTEEFTLGRLPALAAQDLPSLVPCSRHIRFGRRELRSSLEDGSRLFDRTCRRGAYRCRPDALQMGMGHPHLTPRRSPVPQGIRIDR